MLVTNAWTVRVDGSFHLLQLRLLSRTQVSVQPQGFPATHFTTLCSAVLLATGNPPINHLLDSYNLVYCWFTCPLLNSADELALLRESH